MMNRDLTDAIGRLVDATEKVIDACCEYGSYDEARKLLTVRQTLKALLPEVPLPATPAKKEGK